jgi:glycosyltransferase involved in cell wall biosynthesis
MFVSVIVCTYLRAEALSRLLACIAGQTHPNFEVLVIDGSGDNPSVRLTVSDFVAQQCRPIKVKLIQSVKGLTRQRNEGLRAARGELLCFLDDDVTVEKDFLEQVVALFRRPDFQDVGGLTGFDMQNYPTPVTLRWRLRRWFHIVPDLVPGAIDRLGRAVPVSFLKPFSGVRNIGYLPGFCMLYRRPALSTEWFDEDLPTYAGEDRDFSFRVGRSWRLMICGNLHVKHHYALQSRQSHVQRVYQDGFGSGRVFAKHARGSDGPEFARFLMFDFCVSLLAIVQKPNSVSVRSAFARTSGIIAGALSWTPSVSRLPQTSAVQESKACK